MAHNSILQWNCRGVKANFNELLILTTLLSPKILCLQETFLKESDDIQVKNYSSYHYKQTNCQKASGGTSILIHSNVPHSKIDINTNLQAVAVKVTLSKVISICSIYVPPNSKLKQDDLETLILQIPQPFILVGDFNGHSELWGCNDKNEKGKILEEFILENDLCLLNNKTSTYLHPASGSYTSIDLSICHPSLFLDFDWSVCEDSHGSDHFPIIIKEIDQSINENNPKWNFTKANWDKFKCLCEQKINVVDFSQLDDPVLTFTNILLDIANECIPKSKPSNKKKRPWFNDQCKEVIKDRKNSLNHFKKYPTKVNLENTRIMRAKARRTIKQAKRTSWQNYISKINSRTSMKNVWNMLRKISGKNKNLSYSHIKSNDNTFESKEEITNILGKNFHKNSSSSNYNPQFQKFKEEKEKVTIDFSSDNNETYNLPFTLSELIESLEDANDSASGPDEIHYQILKHLPPSSLNSLLEIFNLIWKRGSFPDLWSKATIIPIPKPNKDVTNPTNYRPIALTSCICKTLERIINKRLVWYLESNNVISNNQTGFRKNRSTNDQLVKLETFIRNGFAKKQHVVAIFFDLEKAYDTTWKYGILKDLQNIGLRGNLPIFISNFLSNRSFKVKIDSTFSQSYEQEQGVPQGSILSPTLFNIKINNITKCLDSDVDCSLYVDDFLICYRSRYMERIEEKLQDNLNKIEEWTLQNGFKFSKTKTHAVHFCNQHLLHLDPVLKINNSPISVLEEAKFLGVIFDKKLSFIPHIKALKLKCLKAINLMKVISSTDWGGDKKTLLNIYRSLIRSKLDYGSIVYGSARKSYLKQLDTIHHQGLRLALGAFRTSPIESLYAESCEPSLYIRREKLSLQYVTKLASDINNPAYNCVVYPDNKILFQNKPRLIKPLGLRIIPSLKEADINITSIKEFSKAPKEPWTLECPNIILDLIKYKKSETSSETFKSNFLEIKSHYKNFISFYTDGSKQEDSVACAAVCKNETLRLRLPDGSSIFSAEACAIHLALSSIQSSNYDKYIIFSDSLSVLISLRNINHSNPFIQQVLRKYYKVSCSKNVVFCWIPSHVDIKGNEKADLEAKHALEENITKLKIPFSDLKQNIRRYIQFKCQSYWDTFTNNKLYQIKPGFFDTYNYPLNRKLQVVLSRCRIGHARLTHSFILKAEVCPWCVPCDTPLTMKHVLVDCVDFLNSRQLFYNVKNLKDLFFEVESNHIIEFLKEINLFSKI